MKKHTAIITGASSGLGRELAICFSRSHRVILSGRNEERLIETSKLCADSPDTLIVAGDLRDHHTTFRLVMEAGNRLVDKLILAASIYEHGTFMSNGEASDRILGINLDVQIKLIYIMKAFLKIPKGQIIHINSTAGKNIAMDEALYSASKHGMAGFLKSFRFEARRAGVRVLEVFSGGIKTPMMSGRGDYETLMDAKEAAESIYAAACLAPKTLQIEEIALGKIPY